MISRCSVQRTQGGPFAGWPGRMTAGALIALVVVGLVAGLTMAVPRAVRAAGSVETCSETALDDALRDGGLITFQCSGVIAVTQTIVIRQNTALDATGQRVTLRANGDTPVFRVDPGIDLTLRNLIIIPAAGLKDTGRLPVAGYPPSPPPPNEWLLVGLGGLTLIVVSWGMGRLAGARHRRGHSDGSK